MVNFKLGEKDVKMKWSACHERGTKKKIWVPDRIGTYDLPNTGRALYPLELRRINGERGHILGSYFKRVLHTTRIIFTFVSPSLTFTIFHFFHHTVRATNMNLVYGLALHELVINNTKRPRCTELNTYLGWPKWYKFDGWFRRRTQFIFTMCSDLQCLPVKIKYSNLSIRFDVWNEVAPQSHGGKIRSFNRA